MCLTHDVAPYDPAPCTVTAIRLQDLVSGGAARSIPNASATLVSSAAADVVAHIERGIGVAVHCMGGRGRTGTVIGVALVQLGHDPDAVDRVPAPRSPSAAAAAAGPRARGKPTSSARSGDEPALRCDHEVDGLDARERRPKNLAVPNEYTEPFEPSR